MRCGALTPRVYPTLCTYLRFGICQAPVLNSPVLLVRMQGFLPYPRAGILQPPSLTRPTLLKISYKHHRLHPRCCRSCNRHPRRYSVPPWRYPQVGQGGRADLLEDLLFCILWYRSDHLRLYKARADSVDGDVVAGQFQGGRPCKAKQARFSRRVVGLSYVSRLAYKGAHVDDLATLLLDHIRQCGVHRVEAAVQI